MRYDDDDFDPTIKSRSQVKREMHALQKLGERLVSLSPARLKKLGLSDDLYEAVLLAARITDNEGRRRQIQYLGRLMRETDTAAVEALFTEVDEAKALDAARFKRLERWRDGLIAGDAAILDEILAEFPDLDVQRAHQLARTAAGEAKKGKPPRSSRELFRILRKHLEQSTCPAALDESGQCDDAASDDTETAS